MHPNPIFRDDDPSRNLAFARWRGFGTLTVSADPYPLLSHIPFRIARDGGSVDLHLVRSNPIARLTDASTAVLSVTGPDSYISPDWYDLADQVPTWNYVAVHIKGSLERLPDQDLRQVIDEISAEFEARLLPKPAWSSQKMDQEALSRLMRAIVPFRLRIDDIDSTWKLNQNKPTSAIRGAIKGVADHGIGSDVDHLARIMQQHLED